MLRLGLCCKFLNEPIRFRNTTVAALSKLTRKQRLEKLTGLSRHNAEALYDALRYCAANGIGCFRVNSQILPVKTHHKYGYTIEELNNGEEIVGLFKKCGKFAAAKNLRITFHPDQFVVLNSLNQKVVDNSIKEIEYQTGVAEWIGADVINIHAGGAYGDKESALARFADNFSKLSTAARKRLTIENDDKIYAPSELLSLCNEMKIPLVYDVHHHRCLKDNLSEDEATELALKTWNREPLFHISSPIAGWHGPGANRHHDYIDINDFPESWLGLDITVEVEAKAKELAVKKLGEDLCSKAP